MVLIGLLVWNQRKKLCNRFHKSNPIPAINNIASPEYPNMSEIHQVREIEEMEGDNSYQDDPTIILREQGSRLRARDSSIYCSIDEKFILTSVCLPSAIPPYAVVNKGNSCKAGDAKTEETILKDLTETDNTHQTGEIEEIATKRGYSPQECFSHISIDSSTYSLIDENKMLPRVSEEGQMLHPFLSFLIK